MAMFFFENEIEGDHTMGVDWNSIINQGFGVGSQLITAFGRNQSTQIAQGNNGIFAIQAQNPIPSRYEDPYLGQQQMLLQQQAALAAANRGGLGLDSAAGGIMQYISNNPLLVGGIALGAYLLFREPPRRK